jgi:hypothetical protein
MLAQNTLPLPKIQLLLYVAYFWGHGFLGIDATLLVNHFTGF